MAATGGGESPNLSALLFGQPHRFDFFQAVRLLERAMRERAVAEPDRPTQSVGRDNLPENEAVRFRTSPSLAFPGSEVTRVKAAPRRGQGFPPIEMLVSFMGLIGASGVLPHHYTTLILKRLREKDHVLQDFLDLFQHRFISLFYRAWEKYRLPFAFERFKADNRDGGDDPVTWGIHCLTGRGTDGLRNRLEVPDSAFLYYAGHFAHHPRCVSSLEALLSDYFELPIRVQSLQGEWLELPEADLSRMGSSGRNNSLGRTLIAGRRVWDVQGKFRLRVGPLGYDEFALLMPPTEGESGAKGNPATSQQQGRAERGGARIRPALRPLVQLTRSYVGPELDFDVQAVLRAEAVPKLQLGRGVVAARLGYNTWLHARPMRRDADEAIFSLKEF